MPLRAALASGSAEDSKANWGRERLSCNYVAEGHQRLDIRRALTRDHQFDAITHVETGRLAGVLDGANHVACETLGLELRGRDGVEDDKSATLQECDRTGRVGRLQRHVVLARKKLDACHHNRLAVDGPVPRLGGLNQLLDLLADPRSERTSVHRESAGDAKGLQ